MLTSKKKKKINALICNEDTASMNLDFVPMAHITFMIVTNAKSVRLHSVLLSCRTGHSSDIHLCLVWANSIIHVRLYERIVNEFSPPDIQYPWHPQSSVEIERWREEIPNIGISDHFLFTQFVHAPMILNGTNSQAPINHCAQRLYHYLYFSQIFPSKKWNEW